MTDNITPQSEPRHPDADRIAAELDMQLPPGDWPAKASVPVSILIPVKDEQRNIAACISHLLWAKQIVVVDSQSSDLTVPTAQALGADVYQFHYSPEGWPKKKNWALENIPWEHEWVLILDADEHMTPELAGEIEQVVNGTYRARDKRMAGDGDGYWLNRRFMFMGSWIRGCGYYPSYNIRLLKHKCGRYERIGNLGDTGTGDNEVHEHIVLKSGRAGYLENDFLHFAYPDLHTFIEKHNRYATWEAHVMAAQSGGELKPSMLGDPIARRRWLKGVSRHMPFRPTLRFIFSYILQRGFLDGRPGFVLSRLLAWYEFVSIAKYEEMKIYARLKGQFAPPPPPIGRASPPRHSSNPPPGVTQPVPPEYSTTQKKAIASTVSVASNVQSAGTQSDPASAAPAITAPVPASIQMQPESSPWTFSEKVKRALWMLMGKPVFRCTFHNWYPLRSMILRMFGAKVGKGVKIRPTVNIEIPWMLDIDDEASIGDWAIIYCLGKVTIGKRAVISQYSHVCAGTHDYSDLTFKLIRDPITIGDDVWIGADAFIGPNVEIGHLAVIGARSSVYENMPQQQVCVGNPAKPIKKREIRGPAFS